MYIFLALFIFVVVFASFQVYIKNKRENYILNYNFNPAIKNKVRDTYPHLDNDQLNKVLEGLKEYFLISNLANRKFVSMPSQVVDVAWHEFILFTRDYKNFCSKAIGRFLHHTPAEAINSENKILHGIKRAWKWACKRESINPKSPDRLPLLFALDAELQIKDGFFYKLNCMNDN